MPRYYRPTVARWAKTFVVLLAITNAGVNLGMFSPTLPSIERLTDSTTAEVSQTLIWTGVTSVLGAVLVGSLFGRYENALALLALTLFLQGLGYGLAPCSHSLPVFEALASFGAFFNVGLTVGCLAMNTQYWKDFPKMLGPIIQATDLLHVTGLAITPQIIQSYLADGNPSVSNVTSNPSRITTTTTVGYNGTGILATVISLGVNSTTDGYIPPNRYSGIEPVQIAYLIVGVLDVVVAAICLAAFFIERGHCSSSCSADPCTLSSSSLCPCVSSRYHSSCNSCCCRRTSNTYCKINDDVDDEADDVKLISTPDDGVRRRAAQSLNDSPPADASRSPPVTSHGQPSVATSYRYSMTSSPCQLVTLVIFVFLFFLINGGRDAMLVALLYTYVKESLGWPVVWSTRLVTFYHLTRVLVHIVIVVLSRWVSSVSLTIFNIIVLIISSAVMLATLSISGGHVFTGLAVIAMGVATSNVHPTAIILTQESVVHVSAKVMGILISAIGCGQIVVAPVAGLLLQSSVAVISFPALLLGLSLAAAVIFSVWVACIRSTWLSICCPTGVSSSQQSVDREIGTENSDGESP